MSLKNRRRLRKRQELALEQSIRDVDNGTLLLSNPTSNCKNLSRKVTWRDSRDFSYKTHINKLNYKASLKRILTNLEKE